MTELIIINAIAAIPAIGAAWAAIIAARRSGTGNHDITEVKDMLINHINDTGIHPQTRFPVRKV